VKKIAFSLICALSLGLVFAVGATGKSPRIGIAIITNREPSGYEKKLPAHVVAHGPFVVGQPTTVSISGMPKRGFAVVEIQAIQSTPACEPVLCIPTLVVPDEHAHDFHFVKTGRRGKVSATFTMPATFEAFSELPSGKFAKGGPQQFPWRNDQAVQVIVWGGKVNRRGDQITGVAGTKTTVQVPPGPSP
jgi:hypothetical protein